jgi:hypothetical protein
MSTYTFPELRQYNSSLKCLSSEDFRYLLSPGKGNLHKHLNRVPLFTITMMKGCGVQVQVPREESLLLVSTRPAYLTTASSRQMESHCAISRNFSFYFPALSGFRLG